MDSVKKQRNTAGICFIGLVLLACAWLIPSSVVLASRAADRLVVSVTVADSASVEVGQAAINRDSHLVKDQVLTQFVTRTASSWLADSFVGKKSGGSGALVHVVVPTERGTGGAGHGDAVPGGGMSGDVPTSELIITVSML